MGSLSLQKSSRDIRFTVPATLGGGTLACMIARGKGKDGRQFRIRRAAVPAEEGQAKRLRETAVTYSSWRAGAGIGKVEDDRRDGFNYGTYLWARDRGKLMPSGEVTDLTSQLPVGTAEMFSAFDLGGYTYVGTGNTRMLKVTNSGTSVSVADAGVALTAGATSGSCAVHLGVAWVANGESARMWSFDGSSWAAASEDVRRTRLAVTNWTLGAQSAVSSSQIGSSQRVLIGTFGATTYHCVTAPGTAASWAGPNRVGDVAYGIQTLHAAGEAVFVGKPDGVFLLEGGGNMRNLAPHWRQQYDASNGACVQYYDEYLLAGHVQFLDMLSPDPDRIGLQRACHPGADDSFENSPVWGRSSAATTDSGYALEAFYNDVADHSYVMSGKRTDRLGLSGSNPMTWYGSEFDCAGRISLLHILPSVDSGPRWLLVGAVSTLGVPSLYVQSLPREPSPYASWKRGGSHRFAPTFTCVQSLDDMGDPSSPKNMRYVAVVTENAENTRSLTVDTTTDGGASVEQIEITEAGRQFAVMDTATAAGVNIEVTLTGTSEATEPLVVRSVKLRGTINDERTIVLEVPLEIGRDVVTNRGTTDPSSPFVKRAQLYSLLEAGPVTVQDWFGTTRTVVVEDVSDDEVLDDTGDGVTLYALVTMSLLLTTGGYGTAIYGVDRYG